jgi:hypothetical protein
MRGNAHGGSFFREVAAMFRANVLTRDERGATLKLSQQQSSSHVAHATITAEPGASTHLGVVGTGCIGGLW